MRLVRLPNVFTALADALTGFAIVRFASPGGWPPTFTDLVALSMSSGCLYLSGMAFNDFADRKEDAVVRPNRPIPSRQVSLGGALVCGIGLMILGLGAAAALSFTSLICALCLAFFILMYDFASKGITIAGPVTLGFCRFFNMMLALSLNSYLAGTLHQTKIEVFIPAFTVGIYAAGLTAFSAQEESGKRLLSIITGWIFCGGGIAIATVNCHSNWIWAAFTPLLLVLLSLTRKLWCEGTPIAARNLVRSGVMGICVLDAGLILGFAGPDAWPFALACVGLLAPGIRLAKWLAQKEA